MTLTVILNLQMRDVDLINNWSFTSAWLCRQLTKDDTITQITYISIYFHNCEMGTISCILAKYLACRQQKSVCTQREKIE